MDAFNIDWSASSFQMKKKILAYIHSEYLYCFFHQKDSQIPLISGKIGREKKVLLKWFIIFLLRLHLHCVEQLV